MSLLHGGKQGMIGVGQKIRHRTAALLLLALLILLIALLSLGVGFYRLSLRDVFGCLFSLLGGMIGRVGLMMPHLARGLGIERLAEENYAALSGGQRLRHICLPL